MLSLHVFRASAIVRCCPCTRRDAPEAHARHSPRCWRLAGRSSGLRSLAFAGSRQRRRPPCGD